MTANARDAPSFRSIEDGDVESVAALWADCGLLVPTNDPIADIAFARAQNHADVLISTAADGKPTASVMVGHDGHRGWIYYVAVSPTCQGQGLGRRAVEAAEAWLRARGVGKMQLMIRDTNETVRDFYSTIGWTKEPRLVMSKRLQPTPVVPGPLETHVTRLEMLKRPTRPTVPAPAGRKVSLQKLEAPTVSFYRWLNDTVGRPWTWIAVRGWSDEKLASVLADDAEEIYLLSVGGVPAGFCHLSRAKPGETAIMYFGLMPEFIGGGLGWYFINAMVDIAWLGDVQRVWLNTCDLDHPRALGNYQKAGFAPFGQFTEILPDPRIYGLPWPERRAAAATAEAAASEDTSGSGNDTVVPIRLKDAD